MYGKFSEIPYFLITTYFSSLAFIDKDASELHSMVIGPRRTIVTKGAPVQEMFVKDEQYGYRQVWLTPVATNNNEFSVIKSNIITTPSTTFTEISGDSYYFKIYDIVSESNFIEDGDEIYIRKDSPFYFWIQDKAEDLFEDLYSKEFILRNFINTDKDFIYFGKIYSKSYQNDLFMIEYYNIKDFMVDMVPVHQQTPKFKEFLTLFGDMIFNEIYSLQKNIFSILDPFSIDDRYLNHLSSLCGISIDDLDLNLINKRTLVHELINLLKSKGSFLALRYLWKLVTNNTLNIINFYEIWHDKTIEGNVALLDRKEIPWYGYYNVEKEDIDEYITQWTDKYQSFPYPENLDTYTLATQYKVEIDLTKEPIHQNEIFNETLANRIYEYWEIYRPINRVANYNVFVSPITDLTLRNISLYNTEKEAYLLSKSYLQNISEPNTSIRVFRVTIEDGFEYIINHNLNSKYVLIQLYSFDLKMVIPEHVEYIDNNNLKIKLRGAQTVFALLRRPKFNAVRPWGTEDSGMDTMFYVSDFVENQYFIMLDTFQIIDEVEYVIDPTNEMVASLSKYSSVHLQTNVSDTWNVGHSLIGNFFVSVYDTSNKKIIPKSIYIVGPNQVSIEFEEPSTGYAVLTNSDDTLTFFSMSPVTEMEFEHGLDSELLNVQVYDLSNNVVFPKNIIYLNSNNIRVEFDDPEEVFVVVKVADNNPSKYKWTITHNLNRREVLTQFSNDDGVQLVPVGVNLADINEVKTTNSGGVALMTNYDYLHNQPTSSTEWVVEHNFGHIGALVNTYDFENNKLYPKEIRLVDDTKLIISFEDAKSGYAVAVSIGSVYFSKIIKITKVRFSNSDRSQTITKDITEFWDNDDYMFFRLDLPKEVELSINRIELMTIEEEVMFETNCSTIFKSKNFSLSSLYRIFKGVL